MAAVDNFDLSELSEAAARIENAISWNDTDPQIIEYEDDDDDNYEEDVDWYIGDCDDELDDTAYTAGTPTDDPEKVSTLSAEQTRELVKAKDKEISTFVKYSVVEAASRQGISPSALMKMRWIVTFKDDGSLKARLVVQGFTDQRIGKIPTSSPTASRRSRQFFGHLPHHLVSKLTKET